MSWGLCEWQTGRGGLQSTVEGGGTEVGSGRRQNQEPRGLPEERQHFYELATANAEHASAVAPQQCATGLPGGRRWAKLCWLYATTTTLAGCQKVLPSHYEGMQVQTLGLNYKWGVL